MLFRSEKGPSYCQGSNKLLECSKDLAGLPKADGIIFVDAHPSNPANAVRSLNPSLEMPDSRFTVFTAAGEAQLLADNACAHQFILGPAAPDEWRHIDLSQHPVHGRVTHADGTFFTRQGSGAAVLGDPRKALTWLVNELSGMGIDLRAGQFVTTGTCMQPLELTEGDVVLADYGVLGQIGMRFDR